MTRPRTLHLLLAPLAAAMILPATAQQGAPPQGSREATWPAPTAEDWAKPCLIPLQRTWDDAVKVSKETGKAILVCVNMDGEIASEHYAGIRYRTPEIAQLYEPYVCVMASVYRHTPRDFDENGQRILCPRFGSVTCSEHIWIEPLLYEKFLDGQRVAPRHIMVELDGSEVYDVFYAFDTASVFQQINEGITQREVEPYPDTTGDRSLLERVASADDADRRIVEQAYREGDRQLRRQILQAAAKVRDVSETDLLRLAIFGLDLELAKLARQSLAQATSTAAIDLINAALRVPMEPTEREALIAALERLGEQEPRAKTLAAVHRGLSEASGAVDVEGWSGALARPTGAAPTRDRGTLEARLEYRAADASQRPEDPEIQLDLAESALVLAVDPETARSLSGDPSTATAYAQLMFEDARRAAQRAQELGAKGWRLDAAVALTAWYLGDFETAYARAETAVAALPAGETRWTAMAALGLFAEARRQQIREALRDGKQWPPEWLTDVHSAYSVIAHHPLGTDEHVVAHHDFLWRLGAGGQAARVLDEGLKRFPLSGPLHERLRGRIVAERGVEALEAEYERMLREQGGPAHLEWFAGYASIVAAEFRRRAGEDELAIAAYGRAEAHFSRSAELDPPSVDSAAHYAAIAIAGRARVALERGELERALELVEASFDRRTESAATLDGLGFSAVGTAQMLLARLNDSGQAELAAELDARLKSLDPALLELPAFERGGPRPGRGGGGGGTRRRGGQGGGGRRNG